MQTFAIMLPLVTGQSEVASGALAGAFALNGVLAVAGLYLAFALFPAPGAVAAAPPPAPAQRRGASDAHAAVSTLVMLPAFTLLLAFELSSAMRVLFTIAIVLVSLNRRDVRETGVESVLSAVLAGAVALAFSVLYVVWPRARRGAAGDGVPRVAGRSLCLRRPPTGAQWRSRSRWCGFCSGPRRTAPSQDAAVVPLLDRGRALRRLGAVARF